MGESYLDARLTALRRAQNSDGGWGYFPGKQSWLEPTVYATMALHGHPEADRAWTLLKSWQMANGAWRPSGDVQIAGWGTALCVTLATVRGEFGGPLEQGVKWLLESAGVESNFINRAAARVGLLNAERDLSLKGWPWKPGTSSWVEPTAHTLVALQRTASKAPKGTSADELKERVRMGEAQLLDVRCADGGWNYGSRAALGVDLPSYPETTALALIGLQGHPDLAHSIELAARMARETPSAMAAAWLAIALRVHGAEPPAPSGDVSPDVLVTAVEALGAPAGNYAFLKAGGAA
ncbi:MAG TPA: hypothetical protein VKR43_01490 [Bryobacteraceae bacterium]|nr:hypothetical protein [Bryobacteraceae bacterium]